MFNNGDSVKESQYSDNSYSNNNENSIESPDQNSLIKIFDDKEEEWTFNKKINDSSKSNSIKLENKDLSNKAVLNDKNNNFFIIVLLLFNIFLSFNELSLELVSSILL